MKSKKLIELLQKEDPTGETEICLSSEDGNVDILFLEHKPGYWDGAYQVLERNWASEYYNVTGAQYRRDGSKIIIVPHSIQDALENNPDLPITVIDVSKDAKRMQKTVDGWRDKAKKEKEDFEKKAIQEFSFKVLSKIKEGCWKIIQPVDKKIGMCNVMWYIKDPSKFIFDGINYKENDNQIHLCQGECVAVLKSGFFTTEINGNLIYWNLVF
jgi:hypothetical protein